MLKNLECGKQTVFEYAVTVEDCGCVVQLPNAMSPNGDGQNDRLQAFPACEVIRLKMTVFNRWGNQVYAGFASDNGWDGKVNGRDAPAGLYIVMVNFDWATEAGTIQSGVFYQEVLLVR